MKLSAEFKNGMSKLTMIPEDEWEKTLIGSVAKGLDELDATVTYLSEGHFSYGQCQCVEITLFAKGDNHD